ncbi:hypothetical protein TNCV_243181 [Trichonephila clavipes]|uniref:Uncharacterized protein n=1 Tax=Trichonephila clavipes TaxID=2585209 RepID=A0A8X6W454_TRICX|nr:hypothetical protein TNCV_243181 [Trichonephila clavipes]
MVLGLLLYTLSNMAPQKRVACVQIRRHHDDRGRPRATADREDRLTVKSAVTAPDSALSDMRPAHDSPP